MGVLDITGLGSVADFAGKVIDKIFPDKAKADEAKIRMLQLQQEGQFKEMEMQFDSLKQQALINLEEAKSSNWFVAGWRPYVGWVCGTGLLYTFLVKPILNSCGVPAPAVEVGVLIEMLLALIGVAGLRTYEKINGVAR